MSVSASREGVSSAPHWALRLLGGCELAVLPDKHRVALPGKRERVLLAYLALSPNCRQPRRRLAALLWGDMSDEAALDNLRNCLWVLRKALGDGEHRVLASTGEDIVLDIGSFDVDALSVRSLGPHAGRAELENGAAHCVGVCLAGLSIESQEFETWRHTEAERYRNRSITLLTKLMVLQDEAGENERAIETGLRILAIEPLHEPALRRLMRLYGRCGRRSAAITLYRTMTAALKTELDAEPELETRAVFEELARGGEDPLPLSVDAAADISVAVLPFVNLSRDVEQEFFSDGMTEEITAALAQIKGLRVVGRSSAFAFKRDNQNSRKIGQALGARYLIEGSVRRSGNRVRITARLV